jgi:WD40 repeat protein
MQILKASNSPIRALAYSPDSSLLAVGGQDHVVRLFDRNTGELMKTLNDHRDWIRVLQFWQNGTILVSGSWDSSVQCHRLSPGRAFPSFPSCAGGVWSLVVSPDGAEMAVGSGDGIVRVIRGKKMIEVKGQNHTGPVTGLAYTPDGSTLISAGHDKTIRTWDATLWGTLAIFRSVHKDWVRGLALSRCGRILATAGDEKEVVLSTFPSGEQIARLSGHTGPITAVAITPDGRTVISASFDGTACLWAMDTHRQQQAYNWEIGRLAALAVSPDGMTAAVGGWSGEVVTWDLD